MGAESGRVRCPKDNRTDHQHSATRSVEVPAVSPRTVKVTHRKGNLLRDKIQSSRYPWQCSEQFPGSLIAHARQCEVRSGHPHHVARYTRLEPSVPPGHCEDAASQTTRRSHAGSGFAVLYELCERTRPESQSEQVKTTNNPESCIDHTECTLSGRPPGGNLHLPALDPLKH